MTRAQELRLLGTRMGSALCVAVAIGFTATASAAESAKASAPAARGQITAEAAKAIALKALPGKATDVTIEKKGGKKVYVVEVMTEAGSEKDVFVDMVSGKVLGID